MTAVFTLKKSKVKPTHMKRLLQHQASPSFVTSSSEILRKCTLVLPGVPAEHRIINTWTKFEKNHHHCRTHRPASIGGRNTFKFIIAIQVLLQFFYFKTNLMKPTALLRNLTLDRKTHD
jgi:hypothetical protein